jgi:hypothetical protein
MGMLTGRRRREAVPEAYNTTRAHKMEVVARFTECCIDTDSECDGMQRRLNGSWICAREEGQ